MTANPPPSSPPPVRPRSARPARMLVCVVGRSRGERIVAVAKSAGARGGTIALGTTHWGNWLLEALSLADVALDVVFIVMTDETEAVLSAIAAAAEEEPRKFAGTALLLPVPEFYSRAVAPPAGDAGDAGVASSPSAAPAPASASASVMSPGSPTMPSGQQLITVIVNSGYANDVMAAARKAGATGGTILNARGTGTEEDVKFFGISLVPEKEMLLVLAPDDKVAAIVDAVSAVPNLCEPGGGIVYTQSVERVVLLGNSRHGYGD